MKKIQPFRRLVITIALFVSLLLGMSVSLKTLSLFNLLIVGRAQSLVFSTFAAMLGVTLLIMLYKPMQKLLRDLLQGVQPMMSIKTIFSYSLMVLFGFGMGIVMLNFTGLVIYFLFGG